MARDEYHKLNTHQDDLEQDILLYTEAIFVSWDQTIVQTFFQIALALSLRSRESRQPEDVNWSIRYLRYLYDQPLDAFDLPHNIITATLVNEFAFKIELDPGNVISDIEEMANLCHELLNTDISEAIQTIAFETFANSLFATQSLRINISPPPSEKVIECLREASICLPDLHLVSLVLAVSLFTRFRISLLNDDYEEGMALVDKIIAFRGPGDRPSEFQGPALQLVALFAKAQSHKCGKMEYIEKEIFRFRSLLAGASLDDPVRHVVIEELAKLQRQRDDRDFGVVRSLDPTDSSPPIPPFRELIASLSQSGGTSRGSTLMTMEDQHFDALHSYFRITDMADIKEAINYFRLALPSFHPGTAIATLTTIALANALYKAFSCTNNIDYLNESISVLQHSLTITVESFSQFLQARMLITSLFARFNLLHNEDDVNEMMQLFHVAVNNKHVKTPDRFNMSCKWAKIARRSRHPCTSTAYDCAISLMRDTLTFTPTLFTQHFQLAAVSNEDRVLPLDYASHLAQIGRFDQAIETLEQGRALLWSEMRGLRASLDQLRAANSQLADNLVVVNRDLEMLTLTDSSNTDDDVGDGMNQIGLLLLKQRKLVDDRVKLIAQVRSLPGFESFLKAPSFEVLISAASRGPVIVINHSKWRSDILILLHNALPSVIPTSDDFYHSAIRLRDRLMKCRSSREHGLDSKQYEHDLRSVLVGLYDLVGRPVIERLRSLNVPEQSRIWWCPTSVFCSLPLHAMGPIPSDDGVKRHFLDLYISSYTPSLSALIESRKVSERSFETPSILLVAQPDQSLYEAFPEIWAMKRLNTKVTTLMSSKATPSAVTESLREHRFSHFVCHGKLVYGKPFETSFLLHGGERLTLLDLIRSQLPAAEFAFLSACHTAEMTEGSIADEALHLTAAMQYCGFRSVVGTMWGMADADWTRSS
ncbi:CHAT domain-containing protein [Russula earlei]|uniref:CHAT domain-containing protein n=1 Tax=Russula earlei TaxID=71964 RepID=A0ACC0UET2_9AGAM|nr:CHAT domain-containing protein [Russula earlei]